MSRTSKEVIVEAVTPAVIRGVESLTQLLVDKTGITEDQAVAAINAIETIGSEVSQSRWRSWVLWSAIATLIGLILKLANTGFDPVDVSNWALAAYTIFGIINSPKSKKAI